MTVRSAAAAVAEKARCDPRVRKVIAALRNAEPGIKPAPIAEPRQQTVTEKARSIGRDWQTCSQAFRRRHE